MGDEAHTYICSISTECTQDTHDAIKYVVEFRWRNVIAETYLERPIGDPSGLDLTVAIAQLVLNRLQQGLP